MDHEPKFRALFERAYPALISYACRRGLSRADAEDLVAATLEIGWRQVDRLPADSMPWLYGIAHNLLRNQWRSNRLSEALTTSLSLHAEQMQSVDPASFVMDELQSAFAKLDADDQELLRLVAWEDLTPSEAALVIGCSPVAARTRLHRARNRLAALLGYDPRMQRPAQTGQLPIRPNNHTLSMEASDE
jgi:RNA polymerase sigma factor (sigma-70 family)